MPPGMSDQRANRLMLDLKSGGNRKLRARYFPNGPVSPDEMKLAQ